MLTLVSSDVPEFEGSDGGYDDCSVSLLEDAREDSVIDYVDFEVSQQMFIHEIFVHEPRRLKTKEDLWILLSKLCATGADEILMLTCSVIEYMLNCPREEISEAVEEFGSELHFLRDIEMIAAEPEETRMDVAMEHGFLSIVRYLYTHGHAWSEQNVCCRWRPPGLFEICI